jgi:hypothetical protein
MVIKTILYTLGIYFLIKTLIVLLFQKSIIDWAFKIIKKKQGIKKIAILEIILALILLVIGYFY